MELVNSKRLLYTASYVTTQLEFEYARFSPEAPGPALPLPQSMGGPAPPPKKLRYLGMVLCE